MAAMKSQPGNIMGGTLTVYLVATAWMTAKRREGDAGIFDWGALLFALSLVTVMGTFGSQALTSVTGKRFGYPPGPYFFLGSIALVCAIGDIRMLLHGGISGTQRLARHLWRMCFAWFIAAGSIFLARPHLFPTFLRKSGGLVLLSLLPLMLMVFWLLRIRFTNAYNGKRSVEAVPKPLLSPRWNQI